MLIFLKILGKRIDYKYSGYLALTVLTGSTGSRIVPALNAYSKHNNAFPAFIQGRRHWQLYL